MFYKNKIYLAQLWSSLSLGGGLVGDVHYLFVHYEVAGLKFVSGHCKRDFEAAGFCRGRSRQRCGDARSESSSEFGNQV